MKGKKIHSIQVSLLLVIIPVVAVLLIILSVLGYVTSKRIIQEDAEKEMTQSLVVASEYIEKSLAKNSMVAETLARGVEAVYQPTAQTETQTAAEDRVFQSLLTSFVGSNPETFGGGIWFQPYTYRPDIQYYSPYCMRENGSVTYVDNYSLGDQVYYTDQEWYTNVLNTTESSVWSAPYYDEFAKISMVTSSAPIYKPDGTFLGVATADIDLTQMQQMVLSLDVAAKGEAFLIDQSGVYIAHKDSEKLLSANILGDSNPTIAALGQQIMSEKEGSGSYEVDGETYLAWYQQIPSSGWYIVTTASEENLMADANTLGTTLAIICVIFIVLIFFILLFYLRKSVIRPIHNLEQVAQQIADGNLNVQMDCRSKNEFGTVNLALEKMVERLKMYITYIEEISSVLTKMAEGNFEFELEQDYSGEFHVVKEGLLNTRNKISNTLRTIAESADQVSLGADQVSSGAQTLGQGATEQASSIEELSATAQEILQKVQQNAENTQTASREADATGASLQQSSQKMHELVEAMDKIKETSGQIQGIIKTIDDIAFQTNILALNAAVEAARAGMAGKGFAVVADEVRNLATKSAEASQTTQQLIQNSIRAVEDGSHLATETAASLEKAAEKAKLVVQAIGGIAQASSEQAQAVSQVTLGLDQVSSVVQTNSATAEESAAASQVLSGQANVFKDLIRKFRIGLDTQPRGMETPESDWSEPYADTHMDDTVERAPVTPGAGISQNKYW